MADAPRVFALERDSDEPGEIIGYGLVLPDGSAFAVSWPSGGTFYSTATAQESADLRGANLLWLGDQP